MAASAAMTATKDRELMTNTQPLPTAAIISPATAGPTRRAPLNSVEFNATALGRPSSPTSSATKVWRAGASKELTQPSTPAKA